MNENINNEMLYRMLLNSIQKMSDTEIKSALDKAKEMLSESDYQKLVEIVTKERRK